MKFVVITTDECCSFWHKSLNLSVNEMNLHNLLPIGQTVSKLKKSSLAYT